MKCFICEEEVERGIGDYNLNNAMLVEYAAGYGSKHDGEWGTFVLCDDCFTKRKELVKRMGNWLEDGPGADEEVALCECCNQSDRDCECSDGIIRRATQQGFHC